MPNHWHLVLLPTRDGALSAFMAWVTLTHTQRFHAYRQSVGTGHLYQGRYKSFPVQEDGHFLMVCRYVERNALRAGLVRRAEEWRWSSLWQRTHMENSMRVPLSPWPVGQPQDWTAWVNQPQTTAELASLRDSAQHGKPYGSTSWVRATSARVSDTVSS
jgi:putative transposase